MRKHRSEVRASFSLSTEGPGAALNSIHNLIQGTNREFEACLISSALSSHIQNLCLIARTTFVVSNGRYTFYPIQFIKYHLSNTVYQILFIKYHLSNTICQIPFVKYHKSNTIYQIPFTVKKFFFNE